MTQDLRLADPARILLGAVPPLFAVEVLLRVVVLYATLVVAMRLMGKRMASQLTRREMVAMVAMAAAVGPALQSPDRGLLPPVVMAVVVVTLQRLLGAGDFRHARFEHITHGDITVLVRDGTLAPGALQAASLSRARLFAQLRSRGLDNLGAVERVYLETNGALTLLTLEKPRPGLSLIPPWDLAYTAQQPRVAGQVACGECGLVSGHPPSEARRCENCGHADWKPAVTTPDQRK
jgi:uncharacterized membrane protein YcaP (DUF421 family)